MVDTSEPVFAGSDEEFSSPVLILQSNGFVRAHRKQPAESDSFGKIAKSVLLCSPSVV